MPCVYIVECSDGSYYVGSTRNLEQRLWQHNSPRDGSRYTRARQPVRLVWSHECEHVGEAFMLEKRIQGWSRSKREALVTGRYDLLPGLARGRHRRPLPDEPV